MAKRILIVAPVLTVLVILSFSQLQKRKLIFQVKDLSPYVGAEYPDEVAETSRNADQAAYVVNPRVA